MDPRKVLIDYLQLKVAQEDWRAVEDVARDLRDLGRSVTTMTAPAQKPSPPLQAIPPVSMEIPHNANEVLGLLRLDDEALVDKMFPDYSQLQEGEA